MVAYQNNVLENKQQPRKNNILIGLFPSPTEQISISSSNESDNFIALSK